MRSNFLDYLVRFPALALATVGLFLGGCSTRVYTVQVDAMQNPSVVGGRSYRIVSHQEGAEEQDPDFPQAKALLKNALGARGMYEAPAADQPEVIVVVDYGVGPLRTEFRTDPSVPIGLDPLIHSRGGINSPIGRMDPGNVMLPDGRMARPIIGEDTIRAKQVYEKHLSVSAREAIPIEGVVKSGREMWRVEIEVEESKDDMASVLPILAGAAADYIDTNTGSRRKIRLSDDSESVIFVKGRKE